ncbi:LysR family transcriptional regulator [Shewanella maritima]|uniref:LysR family transcriptional regulator n=1 Tax=Shewanella maritima TaxID=2520507 RepID=UPI003736C1A2
MDKFECLKVFIRVAHHKSFTSTAIELNTTQSAVSKKIAWLEKQVGVTLFHRHTRAINLTKGGEQYLGIAVKLTDELDLFESQLRLEQVSVTGELKLSVPSAFSIKMLSKPLHEFMKIHPDISVDISVSDKFVDLVDEDVDIAIRATYLDDSGLRAKWLMDNELVVFASPDYLATQPEITHPNELINHHCLTYSLSNPSNIWRFNLGKEALTVKVHEKMRSDSPELLVQMAKLGRGIAAMPSWMVENELQSGQLIRLFEQYNAMKLPMYLLYKNSEFLPKRIRVFVDFLGEYFR